MIRLAFLKASITLAQQSNGKFMLTLEGISRHGSITREIDGPASPEVVTEQKVISWGECDAVGLQSFRTSRLSIRCESQEMTRIFSQMFWNSPNLVPLPPFSTPDYVVEGNNLEEAVGVFTEAEGEKKEEPEKEGGFTEAEVEKPENLKPEKRETEKKGLVQEKPAASSSTILAKPEFPAPLQFRYRRDGDICTNCNVIKCPVCPFLHEIGRCFAKGKECNFCQEMDHYQQKCPKRREQERKKY